MIEKPNRKPGRPPSSLQLRKVAVTLDPATIEKGRRLGNNSLSEGIRIAIKRVRVP